MKVSLSINQQDVQVEVPAYRTLIDLLRAKGFWSVKHGCEDGQCGSCSVIVDGRAVHSCSRLAAQVEGKSVTTYEGFRSDSRYTSLKEALMNLVDLDCGYCIPGMMVSIMALLEANPEPPEEDVKDALRGSRCFCKATLNDLSNVMEAIDKIRGKW